MWRESKDRTNPATNYLCYNLTMKFKDVTNQSASRFFFNKLIPKQTKMSVYVIAVCFLITPFISQDPRLLNDIAYILSNAESGELFLYFLISIVVTCVAGLLPFKIHGSEIFAAYTFIGISLFLSVSYLAPYENGPTIWFYILGLYHLFVGIFVAYQFISNEEQFYSRMPTEHMTPILKIVLVNVTIFSVYTYFFWTDNLESRWLIPITTSVICWQIIELLHDKINTHKKIKYLRR